MLFCQPAVFVTSHPEGGCHSALGARLNESTQVLTIIIVIIIIIIMKIIMMIMNTSN